MSAAFIPITTRLEKINRWDKRREECLALRDTFRDPFTRRALEFTAMGYAHMLEREVKRLEQESAAESYKNTLLADG